ncbi:MAG: hypothetical protein WCS86_02945 [Candidatus Paceibacterota bacterium]
MKEKINIGLNQEDEKLRKEKEEQALNDDAWLEEYNRLNPKPTTLREAGPEIAQFENMVISFESTHSLEELHSIVDISPDLSELFLFTPILADPLRIEKDIQTYEHHNPLYIPIYKEKIARLQALVLSREEKRMYEIRMAARRDLDAIMSVFQSIKNNTNVSLEQLEALTKKYKHLSNAVGIARNNKIDHNL